jgi:hypothetical protein
VAAELAFSRAARALAFPDWAVRSLLGLGIARRERGDLEGARRSFERLQAQRAIQSDPVLEHRTRYELALTAFDALDAARGQQLAEELAVGGALSPEERRALEVRQIRAWVLISRQQSGSRSEEAVAEATRQLREMLARGSVDAEVATRLVAQFADDLVGQDLGSLGALLEADRAFQAEDWERALTSYAVALQEPVSEGVDVTQARLRVAYSKARTDRGDEAMQDLEALLESDLTDDQRVDVARLLHSLAESRLGSTGGAADLARTNRAARLLLEVAPESKGADLARYRRARDLARKGRSDAALSELAKIPPESATYPAALVERIGLEAGRVDKRERALGVKARRRDKRLRTAAARLANSLDEASVLRERGELPRDGEQEATMAAMRARAAMLAGEDKQAVEERIAAAREIEGQTDASRQELLSVEIAALVAAREISRVTALLSARDDEQLRVEFAVWKEALADLEASPSAVAALPDIYARLLGVAPSRSRGELRLGRIAALRRAGRIPEAVSLARELTRDEPQSGDAWLDLARSLDAAAADESAAEASAAAEERQQAWRHVGAGASPGSPLWWEARLSLYDAALAGDTPEKACGWLDAADGMPAAPGLEKRTEKARTDCDEAKP